MQNTHKKVINSEFRGPNFRILHKSILSYSPFCIYTEHNGIPVIPVYVDVDINDVNDGMDKSTLAENGKANIFFFLLIPFTVESCQKGCFIYFQEAKAKTSSQVILSSKSLSVLPVDS